MKILFVITGLGAGGAERLVTSLADCCVQAGHEVVVAYLSGPVYFRPRCNAVRLVDLGLGKNPVALVRGAWRLRRLITALRPDVVNSHLVHANLLVRLLRCVTPMRRLVCSAHNRNEEGRLRMLAYRWTDRLADISTNVSEEATTAFIAQGAVRPGRMVTIHNGIDATRFSYSAADRNRVRAEWGVAEHECVVLAVGRFDEQKDYPNLLRAFATLRGDTGLPQLNIVGEGPLHAELVHLAESLGIAPRVHFLGLRSDVASLLSGADVFVLSSAWEGLPLVVAEAMACERVVVATNCGGVREVLGEAGLLVPSSDSRALANGLEAVLSMTAEQRRVVGQRARERILAHYSLDEMAAQYLRVYLPTSVSADAN